MWIPGALKSSKSMATETPTVGTHVSYQVGSDRYPGTVVAVSKSGRQVQVQKDDFRVVSGSWQGNDAVCEFTRNEKAEILKFTKRSNGSYLRVGGNYCYLSTNGWAAYLNPCF